MSIKDYINKVLNKNNCYDVININDLIEIPKRDCFNNIDTLKKIDEFKDDYKLILSNKNNRNLNEYREEFSMYQSILINRLLNNNINNINDLNKIKLTINYLKINIYYGDILNIYNNNIYKLVGLKELKNELLCKHKIDIEINNMCYDIIILKKQLDAITNEIDNYKKLVDIIKIDNYEVKDILECVLYKIKDIINVDSIINLDCEDIIKLALIEKQIEIYVYKNKNMLSNIIENLNSINNNAKLKKDNIKLLNKYNKIFRLFNDYGRNLIKEEDKYALYNKMFDIKFINIKEDKQYCFEDTFIPFDNDFNDYCKKLIINKKANLFSLNNKVIDELFGNYKQNAYKYLKKIFDNKFSFDNINLLKYRLKLILLFSLESKEEFIDLFTNYLDNEQFLYEECEYIYYNLNNINNNTSIDNIKDKYYLYLLYQLYLKNDYELKIKKSERTK